MYIPITFGNSFGNQEIGLYTATGTSPQKMSYTAPNGKRFVSPDLTSYNNNTGESLFQFYAIKDSLVVCETSPGYPAPQLLSTHRYPIECNTTTITVSGPEPGFTHQGFTYQDNNGEIKALSGTGGSTSVTACMFFDTIRTRATSETITTGSVCKTFNSSESTYFNVPTSASVTQGSIVNYYSHDTGSTFSYYDKLTNSNLKSSGFTLEAWSDNKSNNVGSIFKLDGSYINDCEQNYVDINQTQVVNELFTRGRFISESIQVQATPSASQATFPYSNGIPRHHVVTYDTSSQEITYYRNGILIGSGSPSTELDDSMDNPYWYLDGNKFTVGEFRLYTFPLNASQSLYNFEQTKDRYEGY